ncbi:hypothetical protein C1645_814678 [Glomus cerebriforme]|uniref:Uncharacterized protein n=1 Tax=Glomus cerebriforme TaxID=658196 RepID=A0A397TKJ2_9GLOM|nr:hypothetical protein C1645_814678 [Glomus cerebriforme]
MSITEISKKDEIFIKEFSKDFYLKIINIINTNDLYKFENILFEWIKSIDENIEIILELMQNHKENEFLFSSIIGFFYQCGIGCNIDKNKALDLYLLTVKNERISLNQNSIILSLSVDEIDNDFNKLQDINLIIGKYLLSLFYYKDHILDERSLINSNDIVIKYLKLARKDDPIAQYNLGYCYQYGQGVNQDSNKAFEWYSKSANNGSSKGQNNLGFCYINGFGIDKNYNKAFDNFLKSAMNGYDLGQNNLGFCYENGLGTYKNYFEAFEWYSKSANNGCPLGQTNLGNLYYYGRGITKDYKKAFEWYTKSANNGCAKGQNNLGDCYYLGRGTSQDRKKAFEWYTKSSNNGCIDGQKNKGFGTVRDYDKAFEWVSKSADNEYALGQNSLT